MVIFKSIGDKQVEIVSFKDKKTIKRELFYDMYIYFNSTNKRLDAEVERMTVEQIKEAIEIGFKAIKEAEKNGVKNKYAGKEEIGIYIIMLQYGFDFNMNGTETLYPLKPHKYNAGDEITVKIAKVESVGSKPAYRIKGIENIKISEAAIEKMAIKRIKPGDIIYQVAVCEEEDLVWFDAVVVEDAGTKHLKIFDDWIEIEAEAFKIFTDEKEAEEHAIALATGCGYRIVKGGLFKQEAENADGNT